MSAPVAFIAPGADLQALAQSGAAMRGVQAGLMDGAGGSAFSNVLQAQLSELDRTQKAVQTQSLRLAAGEADSLHQLMLGIEEARIAFQLALQVRNRLMESWQDVQRMQL